MFSKLLIRVARELKKVDIPYMVIGGQAVLLYGEPRLTKDIDITLGIGIDGFERIRNVALNLGLHILVKKPEMFIQTTMILPVKDEKTGIRVDFIFSFTPYEKQAIERAIDVKIRGSKVRFASLEDVIIHKIIAGRVRDIEDVKSVLLKNPQYDVRYIKKWLKKFDDSLNETFLKIFQQVLKEIK